MFAYFEWLLLILFPIGILLNGLWGQRFPRRVQDWIACGAIAGSLLVTLPLLIGQILAPGLVGTPTPLTWIRIWAGDHFVQAPFALRIDALSVISTFIALACGMLVHCLAARHLQDTPSRHIALRL